jgi:hypothetical protein
VRRVPVALIGVALAVLLHLPRVAAQHKDKSTIYCQRKTRDPDIPSAATHVRLGEDILCTVTAREADGSLTADAGMDGNTFKIGNIADAATANSKCAQMNNTAGSAIEDKCSVVVNVAGPSSSVYTFTIKMTGSELPDPADGLKITALIASSDEPIKIGDNATTGTADGYTGDAAPYPFVVVGAPTAASEVACVGSVSGSGNSPFVRQSEEVECTYAVKDAGGATTALGEDFLRGSTTGGSYTVAAAAGKDAPFVAGSCNTTTMQPAMDCKSGSVRFDVTAPTAAGATFLVTGALADGSAFTQGAQQYTVVGVPTVKSRVSCTGQTTGRRRFAPRAQQTVLSASAIRAARKRPLSPATSAPEAWLLRAPAAVERTPMQAPLRRRAAPRLGTGSSLL